MIIELNDSIEFYILSVANLLILLAIMVSIKIYNKVKHRTLQYFIYTWVFLFLANVMQSLSYLFVSFPIFVLYKLFTIPTLLFLILTSDSFVRYDVNPLKLGIFGVYLGGMLSCVFDNSNIRFYYFPNGDITIDSIGPLEVWSVFFSLLLLGFLVHQTIRVYHHSTKELKSYATLNLVGVFLIGILPTILYILGFNRTIPGSVFLSIGLGTLLMALSYYLEPNMVKILAAISKDVKIKYFEKLEHQIEDMEIKLAERNKQLIRAQKMESIGTLATGMAHDFNNVLQAIIGNAEIALNDPNVNGEVKVLIKEIMNAGEKGSKITHQILTYSRKTDDTFENFEIASEISSIVDMLKRTFPKNISFSIKSSNQPLTVYGSKTQIQQALMNLIINSRDAMANGGELTISYHKQNLTAIDCTFRPPLKPGPHVQISIRDTGIGMSEEILNHLFEPFFTTKGNEKGTGLGLFMVYNMIHNHGGYIQCYSEKGKGTEFKILIPLAKESPSLNIHEKVQKSKNLQGSETILILEDDPKISENAKQILTENGYKTIEANNVQKGIEIFSQQKNKDLIIDLVLLDLTINNGGAREFLQEIFKDKLKEMPLTRPKIIITTGFSNVEISKELNPFNITHIIHKPFHATDLLKEIRFSLDE